MIASLEGEVIELRSNAIVLKVGGIGYEVFLVVLDCEIGDIVSFYIYEHIREDAHDLFGFIEKDSRDLFVTLIGISGVGVKLGMKILRYSSVSNLRNIISSGDINALINIPGVGKKLAQKIILELKGVLVDSQENEGDDDVLDALESLGYSKNDCIKIIQDIQGNSVEEKIKAALKKLGQHG